VALARTRHDDVVLALGAAGEMARLRVEVGPDPAAALAVEERDVGDAQAAGAAAMMTAMDDRPLILVDPLPRTLDLICDAPTRERLEALGRLVVHEDGRMPDRMVDEHLPEAAAIIGQTPLDRKRIARARRLRAIINVEGNFLPNVDYDACFARGIHCLVASPAFATTVAEWALGAALDLARGITAADRAMRDGAERYQLEGNREAFQLAGSPIGLVGFGDLARALLSLLAPFGCRIRAYDPWLPAHALRRAGVEPAGLEQVLGGSRVIFVLAGVTRENVGFLGRRELELVAPGSVVVLASRAAVVDFEAFVELADAGRFRAATDVFPVEPVAVDDPVRRSSLLLSPHLAGGMREAFAEIGRLVVADLELVLKGLPPVACKRAERETVGRLRSRPVDR
jgi:phosphoglycerate dehydrogenase-like enzyme